MSPSSPASPTSGDERFRLEVKTDDEDATVSVLDATDRIAGSEAAAEAGVSFHLAPGLYTVRVALAGQITEQVVRLTSDRHIDIEAPQRRSPAPLYHRTPQRYGTSHEYYTDPAIRLSTHPTRGPLGGGGSFLMVFLHTSSLGARQLPTGIESELSLCDANGRELTRFGAAETQRDPAYGWLGLSAEAAPGDYLLRYVGAGQPREMPLLVTGGFKTFVFASVADYPRLNGASIVMSRGAFVPNDEITLTVDRALDVLASGQGDVRGEGMQMLLHGKFDNPILGLVGLHVLLRRREPPRPELLSTALGNLQGLLGRTPDVRALELLVSGVLGTPPDLQPIARPPLLRAGFEAIVDVAAEHRELIVPGSPLERVSLRALTDSPWTSWSPAPQPLYAPSTDAAVDGADSAAQEQLFAELESLELGSPGDVPSHPSPSVGYGSPPSFAYGSPPSPPPFIAHPIPYPISSPSDDQGPPVGSASDSGDASGPPDLRAPITPDRRRSGTGPTPVWLQRAVLESETLDVATIARDTGVSRRLVETTVAWLSERDALRDRRSERRRRRGRRDDRTTKG